jgi:putative ABC transport system permease protein
MSSWRPALRIARRTVLRSRARSLLIAVLVGLPVAAATYADVVARTFSSPEREAQRLVGSADAAISVTGERPLAGGYDPRWLAVGYGAPSLPPGARKADVAPLLPAGSRIVEMPYRQPIVLTAGERVVRTNVSVGDVREPLHRLAIKLDGDASRAPGAGEALVSRSLAERLGLLDDGRLRTGARLTLLDGPPVNVSGLVRDPTCLSCEQVAALPGSVLARATDPGRAQRVSYAYATSYPTFLVDLPGGVDVDALGRRLADRGVALSTREALATPPPAAGDGTTVDADSLRAFALVAVIVGLGLLEVVLLAGTSFAVGARRQMRELGLVAASGGSPRDVRRVVLAQGLVLGMLGAALGVVTGFAVAIAGRPLWERFADSEIAGWAFGPLEIAAAALVGLVSGLAAAVVPAVGAGRMQPVAALAGRFRAPLRSRRRGATAGSALVVAGAGCGLAGDRLLADDFTAYERALALVQQGGSYVQAPSPDGPLALIVGGAALAIVGLVLLTPALIGAIAGIGARLPLSARLAVRDAERHRHRTGPATGAIVVAVTGSVVLAFLVAGQLRADELRWQPALPPGVMAVTPGDGTVATMLRGAESAVAELPPARRDTMRIALDPPRRGERPATVPATDRHPLYVSQRPRECRSGVADPGCGPPAAGRSGELAIGADDALTRLVAGPGFDAAARRALADGKVLVFARPMLDRDGFATVSGRGDEVRLPGHLVATDRSYVMLPGALVSASVARERGWTVEPGTVFVSYATATADELDAAQTAVEQTGAYASVERGPDGPRELLLGLIAAAAAFVTLVGVAISVALSAAEGRADLATLAAVGAQPRRRRALMASQALLVGGLGCVLGVALGTFVAFTARATTGSPDFVVPWANLAATAVGVPLLAALVAALCTRSRLPMVRRAE